MLLLLKRRKRRAPGRGLQPASTLAWNGADRSAYADHYIVSDSLLVV